MNVLRTGIFGFLTAYLSLSVPAAAADDPYPLDYWALRSVIDNVEVSPDGKHLALLKIPSKDGNPILEVYDAADLDAKPIRVDADPMEITSFIWAGDKYIAIGLRQKVRDKIEGFNQGVYDTRFAALNIETGKVRMFTELNASFENVLPSKPERIIISFNEGDTDSKIAEAFRPRSYHEFDLERGTKKLLIRGKISLGQIEFDGDGNPWTARGFDIAKGDFIWYHRMPGESNWNEIHRITEDSFEQFFVDGFDVNARDKLLVTANNGENTAGLWEFDTARKRFSDLVYARRDVDVTGVRYHSNRWAHFDTVVGVGYYKDKLHVEYFDEVEGATYAQLEQLIPNAYEIRITSRSRDGNTLTIANTAPRDPGTFYLLKEGQLQVVGSRQPLLDAEKLANVRYITYESRDGLAIPAFVTLPSTGRKPYPLIVLPHGGPFVRERVDYDEWAQLLANNGYVVLQPQYRGSLGYGKEFYTTAFVNGGQGGYQMQDDKDDGALHLIEKGLVDPDRVAMFGWSYGGYAALVAAARTPQIYQCVIAGAAVADSLLQVNYYRDRLRGAQATEQLRFWDDSISPIKEAEKVNVPLLLIHGDVDQRVPPEHAERYRRALDRYNKPYRYVELAGADHFSNTLFYEHQIELYESMIDFLQNDCGPGGL
ncbi:MAG: prolyl oligopeptidase family serine peptidase [Pseudomonadota bacterium]